MQTSKFIYDDKERNILVIQETDDDIFGYDLDLWTDEMKEKLKTSFRHFKKGKIKTNGNVENQEEKKEEKSKKFEV
jgi:hypothetical protein